MKQYLLVLAVLLVSSVAGAEEFTEPVSTSSGPVIGRVEKKIESFKGIAYAAPPLDELRWKPPQPVQPWKKPLLATAFGPACPQPLTHATVENPVTSTDAFGPIDSLSEDCLYLNVWTPRERRSVLPVFVWIHGGGFHAGSGSQEMYHGQRLAKKGAVVVTLDYRIGPFGFLAHPDLSAESPDKTSGNYGLLDIIAALKWVKQNAAVFGGNPDAVTIIGQSGGGVSVLSLMASPLAKGLFQRAIVHSGTMPPRWRFRDKDQGSFVSMETLGLGFAERLGVPPGKEAPAALRAKSWQEIMQANKVPLDSNSGELANMGAGGILCSLEVDGHFIHQFPDQVFSAGEQNSVPLLIGNVFDEGTMFVPEMRDMVRYRELVAQAVGEKNVEEALGFYPVKDLEEAKKVYVQMIDDMMFSISRRHARWNSAKQQDTYLFLFQRTPRWEADKWFRCFHGSDLAYVFGNFLVADGYDAADQELSERIRECWVDFARKGFPQLSGGVSWPRYNAKENPYLILDTEIRPAKNLRSEALDLWDKWMSLKL